ncbi:unnamed protein product [Mesocestoides corti]|uniref:Fibronectin type-III domain-containing protein n=1 Tax=Mesocestoides corti TaxID=53468 RepID=A0A0R3U6G2_MESCO|nr:unnamed protein product [Mesocestoides corti]
MSSTLRGSAPSRVRILPSSPNSLVAEIDPPKDATGIKLYTLWARESNKLGCSVKAAPKPSCKITGLDPARSYTFDVRSWMGGKFNHTCSDPMTVVGWTEPQYPKSVAVRPISTSSLVVRVNLSLGAVGIEYYEVALHGMKPLKSCNIWPITGFECTLKGLDAATEYQVSVRGCLNVSKSAVCGRRFNASGWTKPKGQPTGVALKSITPSSLVVRFPKPEVVNRTIQYTATLRGGLTTKHCKVTSKEKLECQFEGLKAATEYNVTVRACIDAKRVLLCSKDVMASAWTKPNAPLEMTVDRVTSSSFFVSWLEPEGITGDAGFYRAAAMTGFGNAVQTMEHFCVANASHEDLGCSIDGLNPDTIYTVSVSFCVSKRLCSDAAGRMSIKTNGELVNLGVTTNSPDQVGTQLWQLDLTAFSNYQPIFISVTIAVVFAIIVSLVLLCLKRKVGCRCSKDEVVEAEPTKNEW